MIRKFLQTLSLFGLATVLATVVWITAANEENPILEKVYPQPIIIEMKLLSKDMVINRSSVDNVAVLIRAPSQVWSTLSTNQINVTADLSDLQPGLHKIPLNAKV
ncbi:MAG: CdaR family protein, partial [Anaerolineales bacterium]